MKKVENVSTVFQVPIPKMDCVNFVRMVSGIMMKVTAASIAQPDKGASYQIMEKQWKHVRGTIFLLERVRLAKDAHPTK